MRGSQIRQLKPWWVPLCTQFYRLKATQYEYVTREKMSTVKYSSGLCLKRVPPDKKVLNLSNLICILNE